MTLKSVLRARHMLGVFATVLLSACSTMTMPENMALAAPERAQTAPSPQQKTRQIVHASYYGRELAGKRTASGEKFNPSGMTAAHRTLPFGTQLRVTNPQNGRSVVVRVNDRGPFVRGRGIDVSLGAAQMLGFVGQGTARLEIEQL